MIEAAQAIEAEAVETVETETVETGLTNRASHAQISRVGKAFTETSAELAQAEALLVTAHKSKIDRLMVACDGISPVTEEEFDKGPWRTTLEAQLADQYADKASMSTAISHLKVAVIAFTNGILPSAEANTFTKFVNEARPKVRANGLMKEKSGRKAGAGDVQKKKTSAREEALKFLAIDAKGLDEDAVRARMAALDYILREHGWKALIEYATELQAD